MHRNETILESLDKLEDPTQNRSLTQEVIGTGNLQPGGCSVDFIDLTDDTVTTSEKMSNQRKTQTTYRGLKKEKSITYRKNESKEKGSNGRSENIVSTLSTWTKYDERTEHFTRYSAYSDSNTEDEASESSFSKELRALNSDIKTSVKLNQSVDSSTELSGRSNGHYRRESEEKGRRRDTPERQSGGCTDSHCAFRYLPHTHYDGGDGDGRDERLKSRSRSRSKSRKPSSDRYRRSFTRERNEKIKKRSKRGGRYRKRSKSRGRSIRKGGSSDRRRRSYSCERDDKRTNRSKSRGRSIRKRDPSDRRRRSYSRERGGKARERPRRCPSRNRNYSCRRSYSYGRGDRERSKNRSRSRSSRSSTDRNRRSYSQESSDKATERSKSPNQSRSWKDRSNVRSSGIYKDINIMRSMNQSTLMKSSNKSSEHAFVESSCRSHLNECQDGWDIDVGTSSEFASNSILDVNRKKIQFTLTKPLKTEPNVPHTATKTMTDIKAKLAALITTTLNDRNSNGNVTSNELPCDLSPPSQNIESNFRHKNELGGSHQRAGQSVQYNVANKASSASNLENSETPIKSTETTIRSSIDNDIIKKIISHPVKGTHTASSETLTSHLPLDSVMQAVTRTASLENRHDPSTDVQQYVGTPLTMNNTMQLVRADPPKVKEIQPPRIQPQEHCLQKESYCPLSGPDCVFCNPPKVAPVIATPNQNQNLLPPISTPTSRPTLVSTPVKVPISTPKFVPRITDPTPIHHDNPFNTNGFKPPLNGNVNRQKIPVKVPISTPKFVPRITAPTPIHHDNPLNTNGFKSPLNGNVNRQKIPFKDPPKNPPDCRSTVYSEVAPMTYGEYRKLKDPKNPTDFQATAYCEVNGNVNRRKNPFKDTPKKPPDCRPTVYRDVAPITYGEYRKREAPKNPPDCRSTAYSEVKGNVNRQKNPFKDTPKKPPDCQSTVYSEVASMTYGEYRKREALLELDRNFKIQKKTTPINRSESVSMVEPNNRTANDESVNSPENDYDYSENYSSPPTSRSDENENNHLDNQSTENNNTSNTVDNPSREDNAVTTLMELMSSDRFVTLVDLVEKMTQNSTLTKIKETVNNCNINEEGKEDSDTSSDANNITATDESSESITTRKRKTKTTLITPRLTNTTSTHYEISSDNPLSSGKITFRRMKKVSVMEKPTIKNINLEWHSLKKIVSCQACNKPHGNSLVNHYVNEHPKSEVLISRLAPEAAECLRSREGIDKCKIIRLSGINSYEYRQFCFFCNVYKCFGKCAWIMHMGRHTGYYKYKCNHCSRLFASKPQNSKCYKINNFKKISHLQFAKKDIKAYVCDICNYVRLHKKEIEMHLTNEHEDDSNKFTEFTEFLSFPQRKLKGKSKSKTKSESESEPLDEFIANTEESEYESDTDSDNESDSDSENESDSDSENESDWVSDFEVSDLQDCTDENDEIDSVESEVPE